MAQGAGRRAQDESLLGWVEFTCEPFWCGLPAGCLAGEAIPIKNLIFFDFSNFRLPRHSRPTPGGQATAGVFEITSYGGDEGLAYFRFRVHFQRKKNTKNRPNKTSKIT
jgi:hypothetical protein